MALRRGKAQRYAVTLGGWQTAAGNWWEASVREEIKIQLGLMDLDLTDNEVDASLKESRRNWTTGG